MDTHLSGVVACISGDLNRDANESHWTNENIKRWLEVRGGKLVDVMSKSVTHLLCSIADYLAKTEKGKWLQSFHGIILSGGWDVSNHGKPDS